MKKMMGLIIYGGVLFGLSAGGAWFLHTKHQEELDALRSQHAPDPDKELVAASTDQPSILHPEIPESQQQETSNQVPVQPQALSAEEIVRHGMNLKKRDEAVLEREAALDRVEAQYNLMLTSIVAEQREIEGLVEQARGQNRAADEILKRADAKHQEAMTMSASADTRLKEAQELKKASEERGGKSVPVVAPAATDDPAMPVKASEEDRLTNLKNVTGMMESMSPEGGAKLLGEMMDDGRGDTAVQLVSRLEPKKAAQILETMGETPDGSMKVAELLAQFTELEGTAKPRKKR
jgi:hypothetical protein